MPVAGSILTEQEITEFKEQGYLGPIPMMSPKEMIALTPEIECILNTEPGIDINNDNKAMKINCKRQGCCIVDCGLTSSCARSAASFSEGCWLCSLSSVCSVESTASTPPAPTQDAWLEDSKP